jgi:hypothetical protein
LTDLLTVPAARRQAIAAIAAELRAAQEARPAPSRTTFDPECLNPANAIASRRRTAGANLAVFKTADRMAGALLDKTA